MTNNETNPYQSPAETEIAKSSEPSGVLRGAFWCGVGFFLTSLLTFFLPNVPSGGFLLFAMVLFSVVVIGSWRYRIGAAVGLALCISLSVGFLIQVRTMRAQAIMNQERAKAQAAMENAKRAMEEARRATQ